MTTDTLTLAPSRGRWVLIGATLLGLAALFGMAAVTSAADVTAQILLGGLAALSVAGAGFSFKALVPGAAYLRLSPQDFIVKPLRGSARTYRWSQVSPFEAKAIRGASFVYFNVTPDDGERVAGSWQAAVVGHSANLPDTYGRGAEDLAVLMNRWRDSASTDKRSVP